MAKIISGKQVPTATINPTINRGNPSTPLSVSELSVIKLAPTNSKTMLPSRTSNSNTIRRFGRLPVNTAPSCFDHSRKKM
jgi:hypothetical protein